MCKHCHAGAYSAPPNSLTRFQGAALRHGRREVRGRKDREEKGMEGRREEGKRRKEGRGE